MGILSIALIVLCAALVGIGVFAFARRIRRRAWKIFVTVAFGGATLIVAAIALSVVSETPAVDEPIGADHTIRMSLSPLVPATLMEEQSASAPTQPDRPRHHSYASENSVAEYQEAKTASRLELRYRPRVAVHEDFTIGLLIESHTNSLPVGHQVVPMFSPESAKVRTSDRCDPEVRNPTYTAACGSGGGSTFEVDWDITPTQEGRNIISISIPEPLMRGIVPAGNSWHGEAQVDTRPDWNAPIQTPGLDFSSWGGSIPEQTSFGPNKLWGNFNNASFNLERRELKLDIEVLPTLGISRSAYDVLAFIGTILSAALGSGWVWQFLTWLKSRQPQNTRIVSN